MAAGEITPVADRRPTVVLLVEDEIAIRFNTADELRSAGYTVIEAASADEGWAVLSTGAIVDIVFTDVQMPGRMDGLEFAARARQLRSDLKIIVASGQVPAWRAGDNTDLYLIKPYDIARVLTWLGENPSS